MDITAQTLIEQTFNFYGFKAELTKANEYLAHAIGASPGGFIEWLNQKQQIY